MVRIKRLLSPTKLSNFVNLEYLPSNSNQQLIEIDLNGKPVLYRQISLLCVSPGNEFYQLLRAEHEIIGQFDRANQLIIVGEFTEQDEIKFDITIENALQERTNINTEYLHLYRLPEQTDEILIKDLSMHSWFHHFSVISLIIRNSGRPLLNLRYLGKSYNDPNRIVQQWTNDVIAPLARFHA